MSTNKMHAVWLTGHGDVSVLEYREDVPVPQPGPGEVRVRVRAAAVNNTDINLRIGWYSKRSAAAGEGGDSGTLSALEDGGWGGTPVVFPLIQGADACGEIEAVGRDVPAERIGERVLIDPVLRATDGSGMAGARYLGSDCHGTFAEFVCVPAQNALRIHSTMSDEELATFPCSYLTAENLLTRAQVSDGETILVTGASGGVGSAAVQLARRRGARVIAVASVEKSAALMALGAAEVLARGEDLMRRLGAESLDAVIDVVGGPSFTALLGILKRGGRYAVAGAIGGALVTLDLRTVYLKDLTLHGCTVAQPGVFARLVGYIERGEIRAALAKTYPLRELAAAQQAFLEKAHVGKIAIRV